MITELERLDARAEALRQIGRAVAALEGVRQDGLYRALMARYCTMIDTELRHLDVLIGRLRSWAITEQEQATVDRGKQESATKEQEDNSAEEDTKS